MTRGSVKQAVVSMQPSVTNSIKSDRGFVPWRKATLERGCRSFAAFPLIYDEEVFGVVAGYSQDEGHFTEERLRLYQSFTNLAANAVANARLLSSLSRQRDEIRAMASRLADVEESERKQLARELHDRVGQNLTALSINLNILGSRSKGRRPKDPRIDDCLSLLRDMTDSIRNVMGQLRPALLDEYGLLAALREYCGRFSRRFGIEVEVQGDGSGTGLPSASETAMFRIAQEALNNIAKHARAGRVRVTVTGDGKAVRMVVSDDGDGFVVDGAFDPASRRGWGITTMTERAEAIGGFCRIDSAPGKGTVVTVEVPR
jgi:signal transduction histidine kinase